MLRKIYTVKRSKERKAGLVSVIYRKNFVMILFSIIFLALQIIFIQNSHTLIDGDSVGYVQLSMNLLDNQSLSFDGINPTALRTPGYPVFLMPFVANGSLHLVYYVQALLLLLTAYLSYKIYCLLFGSKWSLLVFIGVIFFPPLFWYTHLIITEILFTFLIMLSIFIIIHAAESKSIILALLAGISSASACLVRPTITLFFPIIILIFLALFLCVRVDTGKNLMKRIGLSNNASQRIIRDARKALLLCIMFIIGFSIIYAPWIARNYVVFDRLIISSTILPLSMHCALAGGHCANSWDGGISFINATPEQDYLANISHSELELYDNYHASNMEKIKANGWKNILLYIKDCWMLLSKPDLYDPIKQKAGSLSSSISAPSPPSVSSASSTPSVSSAASVASVAYILILVNVFLFVYAVIHWLIIISFFISMLYLKRAEHKNQGKNHILGIILSLVLFIIFYVLMHGLTYSIPRYFVPVFPILLLFSVYGLSDIYVDIHNKFRSIRIRNKIRTNVRDSTRNNSGNSKNRTLLFGIALVVLCSIITAIAQALLKIGSVHLGSINEILLNIPLISGLFLYGIIAILLIFAFRMHHLSVLFPFMALSFVWALIIAAALFNESVSVEKIIGVLLIVAGVALIGFGGRR